LKLLITRPEPGATATACQVKEMGFEPVLAPCLTIQALAASLPERPAALIVTSAQAIPALPGRFYPIPCFCVGDATAAKMRQAGFTAVSSAAGDAEDLLRLVTAQNISGTHLLAVGERHGVGLARQLRARGIKVLRRKVYATRPLPVLPPPIRAALAAGEIKKALFYSAETAKAFIRLQPPGTGMMEALVLSPAIALHVRGLPWQSIRAALAPNESDLLALLK
jgi:uroporphyrinogen-III synthase